MPHKIELLRASVRNAKILHQLSVSTFRDAFGAQNRQQDMDKYVSEEMSLERLTQELEDEANYFYLAWYDGRLVGYCKIRANREPDIIGERPLEIERIYVTEQFQGRGVGAALMEHCIAFAGEHGHDVLWLGVWEFNTEAVNFYKEWGFELCGSHPFLLGEDLQTDVLMRKDI